MSFLLPVTPIQKLNYPSLENDFFMKRDDMLPFSFGGNKVRIASKYFKEIIQNGYDCVISYGSISSNMNRVVSNFCASLEIPCYVVIPKENQKYKNKSNNSELLTLLGAKIIFCNKEEVAFTIQKVLKETRDNGYNPYYIYGDESGKGNEKIAIQAYREAYNEIKRYEVNEKKEFDFIFHASGTGMTQAGLLSGQYEAGNSTKVIGMSVARKKEVGVEAIYHNILSSFSEPTAKRIKKNIHFEDQYLSNGYGQYNTEIVHVIKEVFKHDGIALNTTYTGKAFWGMLEYIKKNKIKGKNVLFINTGGTPLFFDELNTFYEGEEL